MTSPKTKLHSPARRRGSAALKSTLTTAFFTGTHLPKGMTGFKLKVPGKAYQALTGNPARVKALLQRYGEAVIKSQQTGRPVSFRVKVDQAGAATAAPIEDATPEQAIPADRTRRAAPALEEALAAARARGRLIAANILSADDMLSADAFAKILGTTRVTINAKRQTGQILGLEGAKRGFRFPRWQLDANGKPYAELPILHEWLGGAWAVYRFLVQPHGELDGMTGREALERGRSKAVLNAVESVVRDFR